MFGRQTFESFNSFIYSFSFNRQFFISGQKTGLAGCKSVEELAENKLIDKGSDHRKVSVKAA